MKYYIDGALYDYSTAFPVQQYQPVINDLFMQPPNPYVYSQQEEAWLTDTTDTMPPSLNQITPWSTSDFQRVGADSSQFYTHPVSATYVSSREERLLRTPYPLLSPFEQPTPYTNDSNVVLIFVSRPRSPKGESTEGQLGMQKARPFVESYDDSRPKEGYLSDDDQNRKDAADLKFFMQENMNTRSTDIEGIDRLFSIVERLLGPNAAAELREAAEEYTVIKSKNTLEISKKERNRHAATATRRKKIMRGILNQALIQALETLPQQQNNISNADTDIIEVALMYFGVGKQGRAKYGEKQRKKALLNRNVDVGTLEKSLLELADKYDMSEKFTSLITVFKANAESLAKWEATGDQAQHSEYPAEHPEYPEISEQNLLAGIRRERARLSAAMTRSRKDLSASLKQLHQKVLGVRKLRFEDPISSNAEDNAARNEATTKVPLLRTWHSRSRSASRDSSPDSDASYQESRKKSRRY